MQGISGSTLFLLSTIVVGSIAFAYSDNQTGYDQELSAQEPSLDVSQKSETAGIFPKRKKKQKGRPKMKRHNRSMGKKFKRKNDDSLRDRLQ